MSALQQEGAETQGAACIVVRALVALVALLGAWIGETDGQEMRDSLLLHDGDALTSESACGVLPMRPASERAALGLEQVDAAVSWVASPVGRGRVVAGTVVDNGRLRGERQATKGLLVAPINNRGEVVAEVRAVVCSIWPDSLCAYAVALVACESSGDPLVDSPDGRYTGWFQVWNRESGGHRWSRAELRDAELNTRAGLELYNRGGNPWPSCP